MVSVDLHAERMVDIAMYRVLDIWKLPTRKKALPGDKNILEPLNGTPYIEEFNGKRSIFLLPIGFEKKYGLLPILKHNWMKTNSSSPVTSDDETIRSRSKNINQLKAIVKGVRSYSRNACAFCRRNGETFYVYSSHQLKDNDGNVVCPILRNFVCPICSATGKSAHTEAYCPLKSPLNRDGKPCTLPLTIKFKTSLYKCDGRERDM